MFHVSARKPIIHLCDRQITPWPSRIKESNIRDKNSFGSTLNFTDNLRLQHIVGSPRILKGGGLKS